MTDGREDIEMVRVAMKRGTAHTGTDIRPEEWAALDRLAAELQRLTYAEEAAAKWKARAEARIAKLEVALREIAAPEPHVPECDCPECWPIFIARRALEGGER